MSSLLLDLALQAGAIALGAALYWRWRVDRRASERWRLGLLRCAHAGLDDCQVTRDRDGFARLQGCHAGRPVEVRIIRDDASFRKLPCLWLSLSVKADLNYPTLDIIARARNTEFYAWASRLSHRLPRPAHWSGELTLHCAREAVALEAIDAPVLAFFSDPRAKELLITHTGVRLVWQLAQARRAEYLVLRAGEFEIETAPAALMHNLLSQATMLIETLASLPRGTTKATDPAEFPSVPHSPSDPNSFTI